MNTHWTDRLSEYLDRELSDRERLACEAHLAECGECRSVVEELRAVVAEAGSLPATRLPAADLWPGIAARLRPVISFDAARPGHPRRVVAFTLPQLALAASLLAAVSAGVAYLAAQRTTAPATGLETPIQAQSEPLVLPPGRVEHANFADVQFERAITDLEQVLRARRDTLDPRTIIVIERNLAAIDEAIREARAALDADPANTFLNSYLAEARRKKLDLLRRAATISSSSGD